MSIKLRAHVYREIDFDGLDRLDHPWQVLALATRENGRTVAVNGSYGRCAVASSHPEAMQAAYKLLADLDAELLAKVHESRSSRRSIPSPVAACGDDPRATEPEPVAALPNEPAAPTAHRPG